MLMALAQPGAGRTASAPQCRQGQEEEQEHCAHCSTGAHKQQGQSLVRSLCKHWQEQIHHAHRSLYDYKLKLRLNHKQDAPLLRSRCRQWQACRWAMPLAAPRHKATTCSHDSGTAGECRMPYRLPLHASLPRQAHSARLAVQTALQTLEVSA